MPRDYIIGVNWKHNASSSSPSSIYNGRQGSKEGDVRVMIAEIVQYYEKYHQSIIHPNIHSYQTSTSSARVKQMSNVLA